MGGVSPSTDVQRLKKLREHNKEELEDLSVPDQVLEFLASHENRAFKASDIASQIDLNEGTTQDPLP